MKSSISDLPDMPELVTRLQREANAQVVFVLGEDGEILGHAGPPGTLADAVVDAVADATAETLRRIARPPAAPSSGPQPAPGSAPPAPSSTGASPRALPPAQSAVQAPPGAAVSAAVATTEDDHVAQVGPMHVCAAAVGGKAVLVVVFDDSSSLSLVRLRMKRAREQLLRSLETGG